MNGNPTKKQKDFHNWIVEQSQCMVSDETLPELHHIAGAKAKLKGVKGFGGWYCIGLSFWWHRSGENKFARHSNKKAFEIKVDATEKELWHMLMREYFDQYECYPMSEEEYEIMEARA